ncbi:hypothetical protein MKX01_007873 [Papaver californicum]|nr:hypothetical protein MKX01_007873 [Papaver californicum]
MMELLSVYYTEPCLLFPSSSNCNLNMRFVSASLKSSGSNQFGSIRKTRLVCSTNSMSSSSSRRDSLQGETSGSLAGSDQYVNCLGEGYSTNYVVGLGTESSTIDDSVKKILIPGLPPQDLSGDPGSPISSCFWEWKPKLTVHYEKSGTENANSPALLLLPGFGVGSFHYEKQLKDLGRQYRVYALDFLGQGMSLPTEDPTPLAKGEEDISAQEKDSAMWGFGEQTEPWANELVYSMDLWKDQVTHFIKEVIREPVYIVGNSLGGFVALYFAACNPELVKGVTLLNATPFWAFLPNPISSPRLARMFPWAGTFPLPVGVRKFISFLWQKISDPRSIAEILKQVYADHSTDVDTVFSRIIKTTEHPAAAASFASIMFAPKAQISFDEALSRCKLNNIPICLMYGKEDPWVMPIWGFQVKRKVPEAPYYQITPAGHCPHDEVPEVVNYLIRGWVRSLESQGSVAMPLLDEPDSVEYGVSRDLEFVREGSQRVVMVRVVGTKSSIWDQISTYIKSHIVNFGVNEIR